MTNEEKLQIIDLMKKHIEENESVRVGWAAEQILVNSPRQHEREKLSVAITSSGEYLRDPAPSSFKNDWNIRKNPNYKKSTWKETHPILHDLLVGFITAVFSLLVGVILWKIQDRANTQRYEKLENQLKDVSHKVDSLLQ